MAPVAFSSSQLVMKVMNELENTLAATYTLLSVFIFFTFVCLIMDYDLSLCYQFDWVDWGLVCTSSLLTIGIEISRGIAISNHPLYGLQPYTFILGVLH